MKNSILCVIFVFACLHAAEMPAESDLKTVVLNAVKDGYVNPNEGEKIEKYALRYDNTVTRQEKDFLIDQYEWLTLTEYLGGYDSILPAKSSRFWQ